MGSIAGGRITGPIQKCTYNCSIDLLMISPLTKEYLTFMTAASFMVVAMLIEECETLDYPKAVEKSYH